jgi:hypothetical protein
MEKKNRNRNSNPKIERCGESGVHGASEKDVDEKFTYETGGQPIGQPPFTVPLLGMSRLPFMVPTMSIYDVLYSMQLSMSVDSNRHFPKKPMSRPLTFNAPRYIYVCVIISTMSEFVKLCFYNIFYRPIILILILLIIII